MFSITYHPYAFFNGFLYVSGNDLARFNKVLHKKSGSSIFDNNFTENLSGP
jgi:hypothetical protein